MKCDYCGGSGQFRVATGVVRKLSGPENTWGTEPCPRCGGARSLSDLVFEGSASFVDNMLLLTLQGRQINIGSFVESKFPQIGEGPMKLRITVQKIDE